MMSDILRDHGLGKGISGGDKKTLIDLVNAAEANQSTVKTDIVNKLNAVSTDVALGLTAASTWAEILTKIPQIKAGRKWATGSVTIPQNWVAGGVVTIPTNLSFTPSKIVCKFVYSGNTEGFCGFKIPGTPTWRYLYGAFYLAIQEQPSAASFNVKSNLDYTIAGAMITWEAYE